jgi:hypothetical protein
MTQVKSISISNNNQEYYNKLNEITPASMGFSEQVGNAVQFFVESETKTIDSFLRDEMPGYMAPMDEWKKYFANHPEHVGDIMRKHVALGNILRKEDYHIC